MEWFEDLETQLHEGVRDALWLGMGEALGKGYQPDLTRVLDTQPLRFLMVRSDEAIDVEFDGRTTTVTFLGSLAGGTYAESVSQDDVPTITGTYAHRRLAAPLIFRFTAKSRLQLAHLGRRAMRLVEIDTILRERLREWSCAAELPARDQGG
jgi:hypothetical protein